MNINKLTLIFLLLTLSLTTSAANFVLTHCEGQPDSLQRGYTGQASNISVATAFSADYMKKLEGTRLTEIRFYLDTLKNMNSLAVWMKTDSLNNEATLVSVDVANPVKGWNTVSLPNPIEVKSMGKLFVGYTFNQTGRCYTAKQCQSHKVADGFWMIYGTLWTDYSDQYNALCIEVVADNYEARDCDVALSTVSLDKPFYTVGDSVKASLDITNFGLTTTDQITFKLTVDGTELATIHQAARLASGISSNVTLSFRTPTSIVANGLLNITATHIDQATDSYADDNTATTRLNAFSTFYARNVVAEEGTGTWCAYCPRGIVGMEHMKATYPDTFVGISVHHNDEMSIEGYSTFCQYTSYPMVVIDRLMYGYDPNIDDLQALYDYQREQQTFADFSYEASIDAAAATVSGSATVSFDFDCNEADYRWVAILTEDSVTGYQQLNAYAGGGNGEMGGFEDRDRYIDDMVYNDVARKVYPSFEGEQASVPTTISKDTPYTYAFSFSLPETIQNQTKLWLSILLVDGYSGMVVNAHKFPLEGGSSIRSIITTSTPRYYSLSGIRLTKPGRGIVIEQQDGKTTKHIVL